MTLPASGAESVGGTGGNGGTTGSQIVAFGGGASDGADGGAVSVTNTGSIVTGMPLSSGSPASGPDPVCGLGCSHGIVAQSIGGGGGNAGSTVGWFAIGGAGGGGGNGAAVSVTNTGANICHQRGQRHQPDVELPNRGRRHPGAEHRWGRRTRQRQLLDRNARFDGAGRQRR